MTDDPLLDAARAGDRRALERLLERHEAQIYRFGMRMCRDPEDAKDVLQETLLAMARGVGDFRGASSLSTWLYAITRSFCIKKRRRKKSAPAQERSLDTDAAAEAARVPASQRGPEEVLAGRRLEQAFERAIAALEPMYREVLVLRDVEGLSAAEVAEVTGLSVQAIKSRLHRARLSVRAEVAPLLEAPAAPAAPAATCPDVLPLFSRYLEGEVSADACVRMQRHIEGCAGCRGVCDSLKHTLALCRSAGQGMKVPASVQASVKVALRDLLSDQG